MRVLTWNLFHGRAVPPAGRDLMADFAATLERWAWDVALLQEVPPWWPPQLPGDDHDTALTSRNSLLPVRRALARRWPDLMKSNGGGANAILVRGGAIEARAMRWLRRCPERRLAHGVRVGGVWFVNLHGSAHVPARAEADLRLAAACARRWAGDAPIVLGGDCNLRAPRAEGFDYAGGHSVDHLFCRGLPAAGVERLDRGPLSDHVPLVGAFAAPDPSGWGP